jgi:hypothetical protein
MTLIYRVKRMPTWLDYFPCASDREGGFLCAWARFARRRADSLYSKRRQMIFSSD